MNLEKILIDKEKYNYRCFDTLKEKLQQESFRKIIEQGVKEGKIKGFTEDIWKKIEEQNIRGIDSFEDVFRNGANIGYCTVASKQLSYSFNNIYLCGGTLPILEGTTNSPDGRHTWILDKNNIIDTSLMLIIDKSYQEKIGYIEENRYNPMIDPIYCATKEFTLDKNLKSKENKAVSRKS